MDKQDSRPNSHLEPSNAQNDARDNAQGSTQGSASDNAQGKPPRFQKVVEGAYDLSLGISLIVAVALAYIVVDVVLKPAVCRDRPFDVEDFQLLVPAPDTWSFPSGHTASAFAGAAAVLIHSRRWGAVAMVYAALVGISRLYLCVHWPTDVVAGALIGTALAFLAVWFMSRWIPYFRDLDRDGALV